MRLIRFLLRYFPPGLILEYERRDGSRNTLTVDLLNLSVESNLEALADQLIAEQPLIGAPRKPQLLRLLRKLLAKQAENEGREYGLFKVLRAHILPLTNCAFNKSGDRAWGVARTGGVGGAPLSQPRAPRSSPSFGAFVYFTPAHHPSL